MPGKDPSKTEEATPKKREEARKKGQVAKSREVNSVFVILTAMLMFYLLSSIMYQHLIGLFQETYSNFDTFELTPTNLFVFGGELARKVAIIVGPFVMALIIIGILANIFQIGLVFSAEGLKPDLNKINPIKGIGKLFSLKSLVEGIKSVLKIVIVAYVAYLVVKSEMKFISSVVDMEVIQILIYMMKVALKIFFYVSLVLIVLAVLDLVYQRWEHEQSLKMTKQEVKDEFKQREGDPQVKARIRSLQREMARRRMMEAVPQADVIITNPIELAVALKYDNDTMTAPQVVAKGARLIAQKIKEIAIRNDIPVVEDKPLAQALYKSTEVGDYIPVDLYRAVAEVLAYVYQLRQKAAG